MVRQSPDDTSTAASNSPGSQKHVKRNRRSARIDQRSAVD